MLTITTAMVLYAFYYYFVILRQIKSGLMSARTPSGARTALVSLWGFALSGIAGALFASLVVARMVPFLPSTATYVLQPLSTQNARADTIVLHSGNPVLGSTYFVRYDVMPGKVKFESISSRSDVTVIEDDGLKGSGLMLKTHPVRDINSPWAGWALFDDGNNPRYKYELRVPRGTVETQLSVK
ncbi:MAG: hypothetical protein IPP97_10755 [Candidatus Obscuribacter sp.]|jgi:hypothetical protein|nr:hypothetical protein [Candidatus Obscuribacter sp.]MBP6593121.1 hypothetical protein [Candidatus Obscuribacter sp.]